VDTLAVNLNYKSVTSRVLPRGNILASFLQALFQAWQLLVHVPNLRAQAELCLCVLAAETRETRYFSVNAGLFNDHRIA
jgi:hypothetical protein